MNWFGFLTPLLESFTSTSIIPSIMAVFALLFGFFCLKRFCDV